MLHHKYIYPCLGPGDWGLFKLQGPGLANMMFVAARAYCMHKKYDIPMLNPTWGKLSIGPYLRHEKDKRHYINLFDSYGMTGFHKLWLLKHVTHEENELHAFLETKSDAVLRVSGLGNYFADLNQELTHDYFWKIAKPATKLSLEKYDFSQNVAMHVRLGDYSQNARTQLSWYVSVATQLQEKRGDLQILLFSDGRDEELSPLITLPFVRRAYFGNALADILAISRCRLVIASDSTFSAMGAYIGGKPILFPKRHFPPIYQKNDNANEYILGNTPFIPDELF